MFFYFTRDITRSTVWMIHVLKEIDFPLFVLTLIKTLFLIVVGFDSFRTCKVIIRKGKGS